jgi:hypothetical protein
LPACKLHQIAQDALANKDKVMVAGNIKFEQNPSANKNQTKAIKTIIGKRKVVGWLQHIVSTSLHKATTHKHHISHLKIRHHLAY